MKKMLVVLALFVGFGAHAKDITVKMLNNGADGIMVFDPGYVKASPGDTIIFKSTDPGHNSESVAVPKGAKTWKSEVGKDVKVKVDKEGVYVYKCQPHETMAMVGVIQVGKPTNLAEAKKAAEALKAKAAMNKDRMDKYMGQVK